MSHAPYCSCIRCARDALRDALAENEALAIRAWLATQGAELVAAIVGHVVDDVLEWDRSADSDIAADEARRWLRDWLPALLAPVPPPSPTGGSPREGSGGTPYTAEEKR